jgi:protein TonB
MGRHMTIERALAAPAPHVPEQVVALRYGYHARRWSPLSVLLTLLVQLIPIVIALWVWQPALVQMAPAKRLAVFDVPAEKTSEAQPEPAEPDQSVAASEASQPQPSTPAAAPAMATPAVTIPLTATSPQQAAPPPPHAPPAKPVGGPPSEKPADWQSRVLARLNAVKAYPSSARARRQQGVVLIRFTLDRTGAVLAVAIAQTSGFALLDREALTLPRRASPLPQPPEDVKGQRIELVVPVEFHF